MLRIHGHNCWEISFRKAQEICGNLGPAALRLATHIFGTHIIKKGQVPPILGDKIEVDFRANQTFAALSVSENVALGSHNYAASSVIQFRVMTNAIDTGDISLI